MTQVQRDWFGYWLDRCAKIFPVVTGILTMLAAVGFVFGWLYGGISTQSQVSANNLTTKVDSIQTDVTAMRRRLDELPSQYEIGEQRAHFLRLDERVAKLEAAGGNLDGQVQALAKQMDRADRPQLGRAAR